MSADTGLAGIVAGAMAEAAPIVADAVQLPLIDVGAVEAERQAGVAIGQAVENVRRAGRPKGAINKRTGQLRDFILAQYQHPAVALAQAYSRPVDTLAAELGCSKLEAFTVQVRAAGELLPYIESKMPVAVGIDQRGTIQLVIHGAEQRPATVDGGDLTGLSAMLWDDEQNQGVEA